MDTWTRPTGRTVAVAEAIALLGFVGYVALPDPARGAGTVLMGLGALGVLASAAVWGRHAVPGRALAVLAALSAAGLVGSVAYLRSLADEPSAIPLAGVGVLLLSLVGLVVTAVPLVRRR